MWPVTGSSCADVSRGGAAALANRIAWSCVTAGPFSA